MERIVALVEGHTETHFMYCSYGNVIVVRAIPNGDDVCLDLIVEAICEHLEGIGGAITKAVVLFDREGRAETAEYIANYVKQNVSQRCGNRSIYIGVSDREIENWIVADQDFVRSKFGNSEYVYVGDGANGKAILKGLNGGSDAGFRDKANWLKETSAMRGGRASPSLSRFLEQIDFAWAWATG